MFDKSWVEILKALGHETRLKIVIELLEEGTKCVSDIQEILPYSQANISQHLTVLRNSKVVDFTQDGSLRCYYVCKPEMMAGIVELLKRDVEGGFETKAQCCLNKNQ